MSALDDLQNPIKGTIDSASGFVDSVGSAIDRNITSDEERLQLGNDRARMDIDLEGRKIESAEQEQKELTARNATDTASDNWLSKNIRPMSLIALTMAWLVLTAVDSASDSFNVSETYIDVYRTLLLVMYMFYFGGRSIEKAIKIWRMAIRND